MRRYLASEMADDLESVEGALHVSSFDLLVDGNIIFLLYGPRRNAGDTPRVPCIGGSML